MYLADAIDSEIEVNQRWSLYKHFWKQVEKESLNNSHIRTLFLHVYSHPHVFLHPYDTCEHVTIDWNIRGKVMINGNPTHPLHPNDTCSVQLDIDVSQYFVLEI
jgi:hypothetical protein